MSKVMGEFKDQSHIVGPTTYRLNITSLSFHVNRPSDSWDMIFFPIFPWKSKVKIIAKGHIG